MIPTKLQVSWRFGSGEEAKNKFSRLPPWRPFWISDTNDFSFFLIYKTPRCFLPRFKSISLSVQEKKRKIDFQDGRHLGFPIGIIIITIFDLPVTSIFPTKLRVSWHFDSGEEAKNRFSRWRPSSISDRNYFSNFLFTCHPDSSTKFRVNWLGGVGEVGF